MRLLRCRKCGTVITTQDTMVETMFEEVKRLNGLAEKAAAKGANKLSSTYQQQSAQVFKMMKQIVHLTAQSDEHLRRIENEKHTLVNYLFDNNLITQEKLCELETEARKKAADKNAKDQKEIERIYGQFNSVCQNRTKANPTESKAIYGRHN